MDLTENNLGKNIIFLISQPRTGSTLTQRILGNHPNVHTASEPWLMLYPLYALRPEGLKAEYNTKLCQDAVINFIQTLPDKEETYFEGIRRMYAYLYESALISSGKYYFLDKTPRYYLVIFELYKTFPQANFIILFRNPLAVLCSIINTWTKDNWFYLREYKQDLVKAPYLLLQGLNILGENCLCIHYEKLVKNPEAVVSNICQSLGIDLYKELPNYDTDFSTTWRLGDLKVYQKQKPDKHNSDKWIDSLKKPQVWRFASDYLEILGKETLTKMGYSYEELRQTLDAYHPDSLSLRCTYSLKWLLKEPEEYKWWEQYYIRLATAYQLRGAWGMLFRLLQKIFGRQPNLNQS